MPDIFSVIGRRWKLMMLLTLAATLAALVACLLSPKQYIGITTALPVNTAINDKARIFNQNIEALYREIGDADELDKVEGTSKLDTLFLAVANQLQLAAYYGIDANSNDALYKAALTLKKNAAISRTGYGELKIKAWDKNNQMAAALANALLQKLNEIHQGLQTSNNRMILQQLKEELVQKQKLIDSFDNGVLQFKKEDTPKNSNRFAHTGLEEASLQEQVKEYSRLINEYELALKTTPNVLLVVEHARAQPRPDKPKTAQAVLLTFLAALLFSFLLAFFVESRQRIAW